ncbi:MAG: Lrp/AsnC family transcriptional regulator [Archaeoglobaceae archaeon]|nr:Lrp/AsnC family transcriptional regulator [Archaeoglobaceae archaeon]MCX8151634.1 Lrp/AsnC family transcriptional regulator [Archaeoglobaceae archaeon]MDW8013088.1 Lrp/AsnC family transcriptional regulator [Archaeoglobaceae archaeon]
MVKIDKLDLGILRSLQEDARKSLKEIAKELGVVEGTVYNRINKMIKIGLIKKFIPVVDYSKLGYDLTAIIGIVAEGGHLIEIENEIAKYGNVMAVYDVTGEFDIIVVARFKDRDSLNEFVKKIGAMNNVKRTYTMLVLNVIKESYTMELL